MRAVLILLAEALGSLAALWFGLALMRRAWRDRVNPRELARTVGCVVEERQEQGDTPLGRPVIEFTPAGGSPTRFASTTARSTPRWPVGSNVEVLYRPDGSYANDLEGHRDQRLHLLLKMALGSWLALVGAAALAAAFYDWASR